MVTNRIIVTSEKWTSGADWNGWETPWFDRETAESVLRASEPNGYRWHYDADQDAFLVTHQDDPADYEPGVFQASELTINSSAIRVYPVGNASWVWEKLG